MFKVRFHKEYVDTLEFLDSFKCFIVLETEAAREHYQGIVQYDKQRQSLAKLAKEANLRMRGNEAFSIRKCKEDIEKLKTYFCAGDAEHLQPVVIKNTLGIDNIEERHVQYWKVYHELQKSRKSKSLYDTVFSDIKLSNSNAVVCHVMKYFHDNQKMFSETQIQLLCQTYLCNNLPGYADQMRNRILRRIEGN